MRKKKIIEHQKYISIYHTLIFRKKQKNKRVINPLPIEIFIRATESPKYQIFYSHLDTINDVNEQFKNAIQAIDISSEIQKIFEPINKIINEFNYLNESIIPKFSKRDIERWQAALSTRLNRVIKTCSSNNIAISLSTVDEFMEWIEDAGKLDSETIDRIFSDQYFVLKDEYQSNDLFSEKMDLIQQAILRFEEDSYAESAMMLFASIDFLYRNKIAQHNSKEKQRYQSTSKLINNQFGMSTVTYRLEDL